MNRLFALFLAALFAFSTPALAEGPARASPAVRVADKVEVQIMVVHATSEHSKVDPRLSGVTRYLSHLRYSGFELLKTETATLGNGGSTTFEIEGGRKVTIEMLSKDESRVRLRVQMTKGSGKLLDATLSVNRNGTFIVAGPKHEGGILVLPLTARY